MRSCLDSDRVMFLEEIIASERGKEISRQLEQDLGRTPGLDQVERLYLKLTEVDKDVHIVEGAGAIAELIDFSKDEGIFKKIYAFVSSRYRGDDNFLNQSSVYRQLMDDKRFFWFNDESDLRLKVRNAMMRNRILKAGIL